MSQHPVSLEAILAARERIKNFVKCTPIQTCETLDKMAGKKLFFKCENFQKIGAFKARGALNAVCKLDEEALKKGVVTHSSGNHAQALSWAAQMKGIPAHIVVPSTTPKVKVNAITESYGASIYFSEPTIQSREELCSKVQKETGATMVHPYNDLNVIEGQGTVALEIYEQLEGDYDAIVSPISGGGLISGITIATKGLNQKNGKNIRVFGAEPLNASDALKSKAAGSIQKHETKPASVADGLLGELGSNTWPVIRDDVEEIFAVTEEQIIQAMRLVWERMKLMIEPSGAVPVAVALFNEKFKNLKNLEKVVLVVTGGNVDIDALPWVKK